MLDDDREHLTSGHARRGDGGRVAAGRLGEEEPPPGFRLGRRLLSDLVGEGAWHDRPVADPFDDEPYEVSWRQRRRRRWARIVAVLVALAMLTPIIVTTLDAVGG